MVDNYENADAPHKVNKKFWSFKARSNQIGFFGNKLSKLRKSFNIGFRRNAAITDSYDFNPLQRS